MRNPNSILSLCYFALQGSFHLYIFSTVALLARIFNYELDYTFLALGIIELVSVLGIAVFLFARVETGTIIIGIIAYVIHLVPILTELYILVIPGVIFWPLVVQVILFFSYTFLVSIFFCIQTYRQWELENKVAYVPLVQSED